MLLVSLFLLATPCWAQPQQSADEVLEAMRPGAWKMLGPLPGPDSKGPDGLYAEIKDMRAGAPWAALRTEYASAGETILGWNPVNLERYLNAVDKKLANPRERVGLDSGTIDLRALIPGEPQDKQVIYLYRPVYATSSGTTVVTCGAAGRMTVWWNGRAMAKRKPFQHLDVKSVKLTLDLQPGLNHLLLEVHDESPEWQFEMRSQRHISVPRINRSIDLGVDYLLDTQLIDGSWPPYGHYPNATTALGVYTLIHSGQSSRSEAVLKGLAYLRNQPRAQGTYSVALELMALQAGGDPQDKELIASIAEFLIRGQASNGMWSYGLTESSTGGDLSNTQYAALGLRAAAKGGVDIPQATWESLTRAMLACREGGSTKASSNATYGFSYGNGNPVSPSMTAAGVGTLAICIANLARGERDKLVVRAQSSIQSGARWLGSHWALYDGKPSMHSYYYYYGLERAGGLAGLDMFGSHAWYLEGAEKIVDDQHGNGRWDDDASPIVESFALLFLRKATSRHALTNVNLRNDRLFQSAPEDGPLLLRLSMNQPNSLWVDSQTKGFDEIARVIYWVQAPDSPWQRVEEMFENRFAIQYELAERGDWKVRADAQLNDGTMLGSGTIDFHQSEGISAQRLAYVTEGDSNLAPAGSPTVKASSSGPRNLPQSLTDGLYFTSWRCKAKDSQPYAEISFRRKRKASVLKIVMAPRELQGLHGSPAPHLVEVTINDLAPKVVRMPTYIHEKAVLEFDKKIQVKTIKLRVISLDHGQLGKGASVGFAEVELY
ncbi:MAG: terpene cyclase/mutase family protein [Planctomycetes bacterium]|nr:terpene cyclase/mutase family protein [Planctomycetota bacterium]